MRANHGISKPKEEDWTLNYNIEIKLQYSELIIIAWVNYANRKIVDSSTSVCTDLDNLTLYCCSL